LVIILAPLLGPSARDNNPNQGSTETTENKDEADGAFGDADKTNENDREGRLEGGNDNGDRDGWVGWRGRGWQRLELTAACLSRGTGVGRQDACPLPIMVVKGAEAVPSFLIPRLDDAMAAAVGEGLFDCCDDHDVSTTTESCCTSCAHGHTNNNTHHAHPNGHPNQQQDVDVDDDDDNDNDLAKAMIAPVCDKYRAAAILGRLVDEIVSALFAAERWFDARFHVCMRHWILRALPDIPEGKKEDEDHVSNDDKGSKGGIHGSGGGSGTATTRSKKTVTKTVKPIHPMHE
jgi:hypothetical protein